MASSHLSQGSHQRRVPLPYQRGRTTRRNTRKRGLPRVGLRLRDRLAFVVVFVSVGVRSSGSISDPLYLHRVAISLSFPLVHGSPPYAPIAIRKSKSPQTKGRSPGLDKRADRAIINGRANAYYAPPHARGFNVRRPPGSGILSEDRAARRYRAASSRIRP